MHAERLTKLYAAMVKCRIIDHLLPTNLKEWRSCSGREAIIAGAAIHLRPEDLIAPAPGEPFAQMIQGSSLESTIAGVKEASGCADIRTPTPSTAAAQLQVGVGMALACKLQNRPPVTLCVVDHPPDEPDFWREPVTFAARRRLAIAFVIGSTTSEPSGEAAALRSEAQQVLPAIAVDGTDVVAVYRVAEECIRRARQGLGPSFIECLVEPGRDPLLFMEDYLKQRNLWSVGWKEKFVREFGRDAETTIKKHFGKGSTNLANALL